MSNYNYSRDDFSHQRGQGYLRSYRSHRKRFPFQGSNSWSQHSNQGSPYFNRHQHHGRNPHSNERYNIDTAAFIGSVPTMAGPPAASNDNIIVPVVISRDFSIPPPSFPTVTEYVVNSQKLVPSANPELSPMASEFIPANRQHVISNLPKTTESSNSLSNAVDNRSRHGNNQPPYQTKYSSEHFNFQNRNSGHLVNSNTPRKHEATKSRTASSRPPWSISNSDTTVKPPIESNIATENSRLAMALPQSNSDFMPSLHSYNDFNPAQNIRKGIYEESSIINMPIQDNQVNPFHQAEWNQSYNIGTLPQDHADDSQRYISHHYDGWNDHSSIRYYPSKAGRRYDKNVLHPQRFQKPPSNNGQYYQDQSPNFNGQNFNSYSMQNNYDVNYNHTSRRQLHPTSQYYNRETNQFNSANFEQELYHDKINKKHFQPHQIPSRRHERQNFEHQTLVAESGTPDKYIPQNRQLDNDSDCSVELDESSNDEEYHSEVNEGEVFENKNKPNHKTCVSDEVDVTSQTTAVENCPGQAGQDIVLTEPSKSMPKDVKQQDESFASKISSPNILETSENTTRTKVDITHHAKEMKTEKISPTDHLAVQNFSLKETQTSESSLIMTESNNQQDIASKTQHLPKNTQEENNLTPENSSNKNECINQEISLILKSAAKKNFSEIVKQSLPAGDVVKQSLSAGDGQSHKNDQLHGHIKVISRPDTKRSVQENKNDYQQSSKGCKTDLKNIGHSERFGDRMSTKNDQENYEMSSRTETTNSPKLNTIDRVNSQRSNKSDKLDNQRHGGEDDKNMSLFRGSRVGSGVTYTRVQRGYQFGRGASRISDKGRHRSDSEQFFHGNKEKVIKKEARNFSKRKEEIKENLDEKITRNKLITRQNMVILDDYNSDLNLILNCNGFGAFTMESPLGFTKLWADSKASHGVNKGKAYFEVKLIDLIDTGSTEENDSCPNVLRIGWSVLNATFEAKTGSWSFGYKPNQNIVQGESFCQSTSKEDVLGAMINFEAEPAEMTFLRNGEVIGQLSKITEKNISLFPHISLKNCKVRVNFGQRDVPWFPPKDGFTFIGKLPILELTSSLTPPEKKSECEVIMMIGLPGSGKTTWATRHQEEHQDKRYNLLSSDLLMELMSSSKQFNQGFSEMFQELYPLAKNCLDRLITIASMKARNIILDQANVKGSSRHKKLRKFHSFTKIGIIVQPSNIELEKRFEAKNKEIKRQFPESALVEMKSLYTIPEQSEDFKMLDFVELNEKEVRELVNSYNNNYARKSPLLTLD